MRPFAVIIALSCTIVLAAPALADDLAPSIQPAELQARVESGDAPIIVDVRTPAEFETGHIPGAVNIPYTDLEARLTELDSDKQVALYCMQGPRARLGEQALLGAGREGVLHIEGGLAAWRAAGLPVEGAPQQGTPATP